MLKGIHHAAIICSNYDASKHFYTEILKLEIIAENYREARQSYKLDLALPNGAQIELFSFSNAPERPSFPEAQGLRHLAFVLMTFNKSKAIWKNKESKSNRSELMNLQAKHLPFCRS